MQSEVEDSGDSSGEDDINKQICREAEAIGVEHTPDYLLNILQQMQSFELKLGIY